MKNRNPKANRSASLTTLLESTRKQFDALSATVTPARARRNRPPSDEGEKKRSSRRAQLEECRTELGSLTQLCSTLPSPDKLSIHDAVALYRLFGIKIEEDFHGRSLRDRLEILAKKSTEFIEAYRKHPQARFLVDQRTLKRMFADAKRRPVSPDEHQDAQVGLIADSLSTAAVPDIKDQLMSLSDYLEKGEVPDVAPTIIWKSITRLKEIHRNPQGSLRDKRVALSFTEWASEQFGPPPHRTSLRPQEAILHEQTRRATHQANREAYRLARKYEYTKIPFAEIANKMMAKYFRNLLQQYTGATTRSGVKILTDEWKRKRESIRGTLRNKMK